MNKEKKRTRDTNISDEGQDYVYQTTECLWQGLKWHGLFKDLAS
jgi:hypothetical protein